MGQRNYDVADQLPKEMRQRYNDLLNNDFLFQMLTPTAALEVVSLADGLFIGQRAQYNLLGIFATGSLQAVTVANLVDGETFTINDGVNAATVFEFDKTGNGVTVGHVPVDVHLLTTAAQVGAAMTTAINGVGDTLNVTASNGAAGLVNVVNNNLTGSVVAITETVANAGFTVSGFTAAGSSVVTPVTPVPGYTTVTLATLTQSIEFQWTAYGWAIVGAYGSPVIA